MWIAHEGKHAAPEYKPPRSRPRRGGHVQPAGSTLPHFDPEETLLLLRARPGQSDRSAPIRIRFVGLPHSVHAGGAASVGVISSRQRTLRQTPGCLLASPAHVLTSTPRHRAASGEVLLPLQRYWGRLLGGFCYLLRSVGRSIPLAFRACKRYLEVSNTVPAKEPSESEMTDGLPVGFIPPAAQCRRRSSWAIAGKAV